MKGLEYCLPILRALRVETRGRNKGAAGPDRNRENWERRGYIPLKHWFCEEGPREGISYKAAIKRYYKYPPKLRIVRLNKRVVLVKPL